MSYYNEGNLARNAKTFQDDLKLYDKSIELNLEFGKVYNNKGTILKELKCYHEAIYFFNKTIELNPKSNIYGYNNKGICSCSLSEYNKAIEQFDLALQLDPNDADALLHKNCAIEQFNNQKQTNLKVNE